MVKVKNALLSFFARGKLGNITLRRSRKLDVAEKIPVVRDQKTPAQLAWRTMYQKAVALWHALSAAEKQEWESSARPKHMTGFAWFMSQALKPNPGLYLPLQGGTMAGDIDMAKHRVLMLPLPTDDQEAASKKYHDDNLPPGGYTAGARVYNNVLQAIPDITWTALSLNSERYDTDAIHDLVTNNSRLTCRTAGVYSIAGHISFFSGPVGLRGIAIRLNGATYIGIKRSPISAAVSVQLSIASIYLFAIDDWIELMAYQASGGALNVPDVGNSSPEFMMQRIG
ncbi:hypothetical protein ES705_45352 [subsurface metagenome]